MRRGAIVAGVVLLAGLGVARAAPYTAYETFARVIGHVLRGHVDPQEEGDLVYRALTGLAASLDEHSAFYRPEEVERANEAEAVGYGWEFTPTDDGWRLTHVTPEGPAANAGLRTGDTVIAVDGVPRAPVPSSDRALARLTVVRDGKRYDVPLVPGAVRPVSVQEHGDARVLRIRAFPEGTAEQALAAVRGASRIVMDVRGNPGGRPEEAVALVDHFVRSGRILASRGRLSGAASEHVARDQVTDVDVPLVVLVDEETASATEIVAGALQDLGRARVVGQPTHGKGSVQTVYRYADGSALRLTIARWELPSGRVLGEGRGIVPDVLVPRSPREQARVLADAIRHAQPDGPERTRQLALLQELSASLPDAGATDTALAAAIAALPR